MSEQSDIAKRLFREKAFKKISSPEALDQAIRVSKPYVWVVLLGFAIVIAACVVWGFIGSVPTKVNGMGVLVSSGDMVSISYPNNGVVKDVFVSRGERVERGQIIARVERLDMLEQIKITTNKIINLQTLYEQTANYSSKRVGLTSQMIGKAQDDYRKQIENVNEQIHLYNEKEKAYKKLFEEGNIPENQYIEIRNTCLALEKEKQQLETSIRELNVNKVQTTGETDQTLLSLSNQIDEAKLVLATQQSDYQQATRIVSDYAGTIIEINVTSGTFIGAGTVVATMAIDASDGTTLHARFYFPAEEGKLIKRGMSISISPTTVKQEEFGCIQGIITDVSNFPIGQEYLVNTLQNTSYASLILKNTGAPIEVIASLIPNPSNYSGLKWTSSKGPAEKMEPGIFCTSFVITKNQRPYELVIPTIKRKLLGIGE